MGMGALCLAAAGHAQDAAAPAEPVAAPPAPAAASAPPAAVPDKSAPPRLIAGSCTRPDYPIASAAAKEAGTTVILVSVNEKGVATKSEVGMSSRHARLDASLRYTVMGCDYTPARNAQGLAVAGLATVRHEWKLQDALPDPWETLRAATRQSQWTATADLDRVTFTAPSSVTAEQRTKILRRLQETARENANCASIERVTPAPLPAAWKMPESVKSASGRPVRLDGEVWNTVQCDVGLTFGLVLRYPEDEPAHFVMVPLPPESVPRAPVVAPPPPPSPTPAPSGKGPVLRRPAR